MELNRLKEIDEKIGLQKQKQKNAQTNRRKRLPTNNPLKTNKPTTNKKNY